MLEDELPRIRLTDDDLNKLHLTDDEMDKLIEEMVDAGWSQGLTSDGDVYWPPEEEDNGKNESRSLEPSSVSRDIS